MAWNAGLLHLIYKGKGDITDLKNSTVKVVVNVHLTNDVSCQQGIKQGCVLSPLLFILYMAEVGSFLENQPSGIKLQGVHISGLLYVEDLILIGKTPDDVKISSETL